MDTIKQIFDKIVLKAKGDGAKIELLISGGENLSLGFQKRKLEKFSSTDSRMAGFRVILKGHQGYAYSENLSEESLFRTYEDALNNAKTLGGSEETEIQLVKPGPVPEMKGLFFEEDISMDQKMAAAEALESAALAADPRVQAVPFCSFNEGKSYYRILNSEGLDQEFKMNYYSGYAYPLVKDGDSSKSAFDMFFARRFADVDTKTVAEGSVQKAVKCLGATQLKTGNYPVVLDREVFAKIVELMAEYFSAKEVYEKKSLLQGKLGQKIGNDKFNLIDDPFELKGLGARPFDSEGAPSQKTALFENGVLKNYLTNLEYSQKMNLPHTAHASRGPSSVMDISPTNLIVASGAASRESLLKKYPKAVFVTKLEGSPHAGFKSATGDISMPSEGFLYENGVCIGPVDQFVLAGNILDLLRDIEDLGNEHCKATGAVLAPDALIKSMSFAGA